MDPEQFLATHWQKRPLMQRQADAFSGPVLPVDEAAWLATLADVESRLVFTDRSGDDLRYRLDQGPFEERELADLPDRDWTLLVNDVDKHLPDFRDWFSAIDFIPDWRIDDLMISVAAPGGSVGPHLDNYDVFLVQVTGEREWITGDPSAVKPDPRSEGLSLLAPFDAVDRWTAVPGDVLYLPPGMPHWGVAKELCTTYSIGMRAPTRNELLAGDARIRNMDPVFDEDEAFYTDPDLVAAEAGAGRIAPEAIDRIRAQGLLGDERPDVEIATVLGSVITDPKAWLLPDPLPATVSPTRIHGMARLAWSTIAAEPRVFVNGESVTVTPDQLAVFREWCRSRQVTADGLAALAGYPGGCDLADWLRRQGTFDADHDVK